MSLNIRPYKPEDYKILAEWHKVYDETCPTEGMIPTTTFILELQKQPVLAVSLILPNIQDICYVENFVGNPVYKGELRKQLGLILLDYISKVAKQMGYKKLFCLGYKDKIKARYEEMGFINILNNISSFIKEL